MYVPGMGITSLCLDSDGYRNETVSESGGVYICRSVVSARG